MAVVRDARILGTVASPNGKPSTHKVYSAKQIFKTDNDT